DAARTSLPGTPLVRADMRRLPFRDAAFTLVVNLFMSFGCFRENSHHAEVLKEVSRVTALGGWLVLDFLNAARVRLFEPRDFEVMLADFGFRVADVWGDYDGTALDAASPRAFFCARRVMVRGC
ncbi:MAG TPA: methyltransferase domain-containing protein, partial [Vicinamibacterales bacterium]